MVSMIEKIKRRAVLILVTALICSALLLTAAAKNSVEHASSDSLESVPIDPGEEMDPEVQESIAQMELEQREAAEKYIHSEEDVQYYAYLDLDSADESLKPVILAARKQIIYRHTWVADGLSAYILDVDGSVESRVPEFSEIFPADWEPPIGCQVMDEAKFKD